VTVTALVDSPATLVYASVYVTFADLTTWADRLYVDSVSWAGPGSVDEQADAIHTLAPDATVQPRDEFVEETQVEANQDVNVMAMVLLLFAAIALFVSVLVIANTFSILFAQRQREFALMRCVGATRRQVQRSIRSEALALGIGASLVALAIGTALGHGVVTLVNDQWPEARLGDVDISFLWYAAGLAIGTLVTLVASWLPTRRAIAVSPLAALRPDTGVDVRTSAGRWRIALGIGAVAVGVVLLAASVSMEVALVMVAGGGATFGGVLLLGPLLVPALIRVVGRAARRLAGAPGRLATDNAVRNPRRTATTAASLLVGVTLTTAVLTGMASARAAIGSEMDQQHPLDGVLTATSQQLPADLLDDVRSTPGVAEAVAVPGTLAKVEGIGRIPVLEGGDPAALGRGSSSTLSPRPGVIRLPWQELGDGQAAGDWVTVTVGDRSEQLRIATGEGWGRAALVAPATLARLADAPTTQAVWLRATDDADPDDLGGDLEALAGRVEAEVENGLGDRAWVDLQLDVVTGAVVGLLGIAVVIALIGIANTLGLSVLERARENALLRALGLTRRQLRVTLAIEAVLLSVVATLIGTTLGVTFAWVGVQALVRPVIESAPVVFPLGQLGLVVLVAGVAGLLAGVLPARRAARTAPAAGLGME
jgi:putative ABC transport system permease protein